MKLHMDTDLDTADPRDREWLNLFSCLVSSMPKAEEPKAEEPKAEEPKAEEPKAEEPKAEEPPKKTKPKRKRRTKAQIAADKAAEEAAKGSPPAEDVPEPMPADEPPPVAAETGTASDPDPNTDFSDFAPATPATEKEPIARAQLEADTLQGIMALRDADADALQTIIKKHGISRVPSLSDDALPVVLAEIQAALDTASK